MILNKPIRVIALSIVFIITFSVFFADGYLQWVNSDTAGEAYSISQDIRFPQGLLSNNSYRSRITGHILSYLPFNVAGSIYRELFADPVNSLYFSQGLMTGIIYMLLVFISAAYVSLAANILSIRYLVSAAIVMLFTMAFPPIINLSTSFGLSVRFSHQAVMSNYVGSMVITLFCLFPYWRYICIGEWDDIYNNVYLRIVIYFLVFSAAFSSTAMTIWLIVITGLTIITHLTHMIVKSKLQKGVKIIVNTIIQDSKFHPISLLFVLSIFALAFETVSVRGSSTLDGFSLGGYLFTYCKFFLSRRSIPYIAGFSIFYAAIYVYSLKIANLLPQQNILFRLFPWFILFNLIYIFIIGMPSVVYRFGNHNLGRDTIFAATWTMSLFLLAIVFSYWKENKLVWIAPLLLFVLFTNSINFFSFPYFGYREDQKKVFDAIYKWNVDTPPEIPLRVSWQRIAFSSKECEAYTIPMLRKVGIISYNRNVTVIP